MKKFLFFLVPLFLLFFFVPEVQASEVFGKISTNPSKNNSSFQTSEDSIEEEEDSGSSSDSSSSSGGGDLGDTVSGDETENTVEENETEEENDSIAEIIASSTPADLPKEKAVLEDEPIKMILGAKIYPDGTLLRGPDKRIYLIKNSAKKYIVDLEELSLYAGRKIISASAEELSCYKNRGHLDGELIRQREKEKVYVIINGAKKHILNLEELRAHYAGLEIFNIEPEEMAEYKDWK